MILERVNIILITTNFFMGLVLAAHLKWVFWLIIGLSSTLLILDLYKLNQEEEEEEEDEEL